jgi:hypothetical protein
MAGESGEGSGWTFLKVVGVIFGLLGVAGFGLCSLCGFVISGGDGDIVLLALLGAGLAFLFGWLVVAIFRRARRDTGRGT